MTIIPLKRYGQNFLINQAIAIDIIKNLNITKDDTIVEIGPGRGVLSRIILQNDFLKYYAVEVDDRFEGELNWLFSQKKNAFLIIDDVRKFSIAQCLNSGGRRIKVVGNIPYNLTSPIIFYLLDSRRYINEALLMVQREVASRLVALPGTKEYGILSVLVGAQSIIEPIRHVRAENFYPVPKVDSSIIKLKFHAEIEGVQNIENFRRIVRQSFQTRRKTLRNNLIRFLTKETINQLQLLDLSRRPEELTIEEFKLLVKEIESLEK